MQFKYLVKQAFDRSAKLYNQYAGLQKEIVVELLEVLYHNLQNNIEHLTFLDGGCGTGYLGLLNNKKLSYELTQLDLSLNMCLAAKNYNPSAITVNGDMEQLPFSDQSFDVVLSASSIQWLENLDQGFNEMFRVLKSPGTIAFATFGLNTLYELRKSFTLLDDDEHVNKFPSDAEIIVMLEKSGFKNIQKTVCTKILYFADILSIMRYLQNLGASYKGIKKYKYLLSKEKLARLGEIYNKCFSSTKGLVTSWEIYYFVAVKI